MADTSKLTTQVDRVISLDTAVITILTNLGSSTDQVAIDTEVERLRVTNDLLQTAVDNFNNPPA